MLCFGHVFCGLKEPISARNPGWPAVEWHTIDRSPLGDVFLAWLTVYLFFFFDMALIVSWPRVREWSAFDEETPETAPVLLVGPALKNLGCSSSGSDSISSKRQRPTSGTFRCSAGTGASV
ncbi:hypothetical protein SODALDRAFT_143635 [Sodiomyces alkalinus F11]|uniref:Uncharacterized protein n=1 Tax=Sodiomyces alkalinus (strain CBS 110278 / VKM F-3762 / F11) TaxID=1314773 RepID=A0A3N2PZR8_SODAK|nr:hypothetical protein SODALDRAFT_143635 [Sodiomyces alkalinus F11]ROT40019.1 hypothetical protein SODALDRAFT_143635 [Sodiomyces alkalinus F11]